MYIGFTQCWDILRWIFGRFFVWVYVSVSNVGLCDGTEFK